MLHVALEVPLGQFTLGRLLQRHDARATRVQMLGEPLDRTALARRVPTLEDDHDLLTGLLDPRLQLQQLDLQPALLTLVSAARHLLVVRVAVPPWRIGIIGRGLPFRRALQLRNLVDLRRHIDLIGLGHLVVLVE